MKKNIKYIAIGAVAALALGVFTASRQGDFPLGRTMEMLLNTFREINLFYVDPVDPDQLLADAAEGMTSGLDPYTTFISEKEMEQFAIFTTGKYGGIGAIIRQKGDWVTVAQPYEGFPADKAGLQIGDRILAIDGESTEGKNTSDVSSRLKGDPGTKVMVTVEKFFTGATETVAITRERINIPGVPYYGFVGDGIGYIQLTDFTEDCSTEMRHALMELRKEGKLKGLIIDLRDNGGGLLQEAVKILSMFVPRGTEVVSMRGKLPEMTEAYKTETAPVDLELPLAVLTNSGSASAAEIVAGALQDLDRAVLVGQRSFGKGLVQSTRPVGYNAYVKITTAKYYIPSGRCIQAVDYSHRNEDGSVASVPDSLIREFTTAAGRKVYDGGGIMPDVRMPAHATSNFTVIAYNKGYIDDFCDVYAKRNPLPADPAAFRLSEGTYAEFKEFMKDKDMDYRSDTKLALELLTKKARQERLYDQIKDQIAALENNLKDDKSVSLDLYRDELAPLIESDLVMRKYYMRGVIEHNLASDKEVAQAARILRDGGAYKEIVASRDTDRK